MKAIKNARTAARLERIKQMVAKIGHVKRTKSGKLKKKNKNTNYINMLQAIKGDLHE